MYCRAIGKNIVFEFDARGLTEAERYVRKARRLYHLFREDHEVKIEVYTPNAGIKTKSVFFSVPSANKS